MTNGSNEHRLLPRLQARLALRFGPRRAAFAAAAAVLGLGLMLTAAAVLWQQRSVESEARIRFDQQGERVLAEITRRFNTPVYGIKGARGVYAADPHVNRAEFRAYVESRDLPVEFPGVRGFGFAQRVLREELDDFIAAERADDAPRFAVRTSGNAADLYVVKFIEPLSQNYPAWGFDLGSEAVRREAIDRAADSGEPTLSGHITLAQDGRQGAGFVYLVPVFRDRSDPTTPAQRRKALHGLLYAPIVVAEILAGAAETDHRQVDFRLFDGADNVPGNLIFDTTGSPEASPRAPGSAVASANPLFTTSHALVIGGRALTLRVASTPLFDAGVSRSTPVGLGAGGMLISVLLALTAWLLVAGRARALRLAQAMTADLDRLAKVAQRTSNAVVITDARGRITWVNEGYSRISGYSFEEALRRPAGAMLPSEPNDEATLERLRAALGAGTDFKGELLDRGKSGQPYWLDIEVQPLRDARGGLAGFMAIESDISQSKQAAQLLVQERARLASILEGTNVGTWEWNVQTGEYRCNDRWADMIGWTLRELEPVSSQTWLDHIHPGDVSRAGKLLDKHFSGEVAYYEFEGRMRHRAGHWIWVLDRGRVSTWMPDGRPEWMAGTQMDISARKQAEAQLHASRAFLDRAGRLAGVGGWQLEIANEALVWTDELCRICEMPVGHVPRLDEAIGFFSPEARPVIEHAVQEAMARGTPWDLELPFVTAKGRALWVRALGEAEYEDGRPVRLVGALQDVTARRAMEAELRHGDAVKRSILDNLPCGLSVFNSQLELVSHNEQFKSLLELPDALFAAPVTTFASIIDHNARRGEYGPGDVEQIVNQAVARARAPTAHRFERQRPNGIALEIHGAPMPGGGFVTTYTDVTERKRTEATLQGTTALLRSVLDAASQVAVIATGRDLKISVFNKGAERMLGYAADEVLDRHTPALFADATEVAVRSAEASLKFGRPIRGPAVLLAAELLGEQREWTFVRKDGSRLTVSMVVTATRTEAGEVSGYLGVAHDVTRQKEHEESLRQAMHRAEAANVAKSQFLANMSHEIRTPMNAILGMLALLQKTALTPRQLDYAGKTEGAARSLLGLLNDILDFSKVEAGKMVLDPHPFRVDQLLRDLSVILSTSVGQKPVEVLFDIDPALPRELVGDGMRLQQVLINLGGNAIKFTGQGEVVVRLRVIERSASDVTLEFAVQDSGIGIAAEHQAHVFDGFSQAEASTTRRFGGTGLGLSICKRLVALMGGELALDSTLGVGSRFHFKLRLPLADASAPPPSQPDGAAPLRVLIVDDNATAREVMANMGQSLGWQVSLAADGAQALAMMQARASAAPYEAVFIDWQMPGIDGWETSQRMRELPGKHAAPLVVMVTAYGREMLALRSATEQAALDGFLVKPVTASMLFDALTNARADAGRPHLSRRSAVSGPARLAGLRVLVVEDNAINRQVADELLSSEGATVTLANNGREGVDAVLCEGARFDVVLMDIQMPVMDGYGATAEIRQRFGPSQLPVIAMTANAMPAVREACLAAGMNDHIGKPFNLEHLVATLQPHGGQQTGASPRSMAAPTALPDSVFGLAEQADIELRAALARLGGNVAVYSRLLRTFAEDLQAMPSQLATLLHQNKRVEAARLMHTFKGVAATLGVRALARATGDAESRIASATAPDPLDGLVARIEAQAATALAALAPLAAALGATLNAAPPAPQPAFDARTLRHQLGELAGLLNQADMRALEMHAQLQSQAAHLKQALQPLDEAMAALDFAQAAAHCRSLIEDFASLTP